MGALGSARAEAALPADTTWGIHIAQPFDYNEIGGPAGTVDYTWGADKGPPSGSDPAAWHGYYIPWGRDMSHSLSWFRAHHPTWIMYKADGSTPATTFGQTNMPYLDMTNPAVQKWYVDEAVSALATGYRDISWDNGVSYNLGGAVGHYDTLGNWLTQYSGNYADPIYALAQKLAFEAVTATIRIGHLDTSSTLNQSFSCDPTWQLPIATTDMLLDEGTFTHGGDGSYATTAPHVGCQNEWAQLVQTYQMIQKNEGKGLVLLSEVPYTVSPYMTDTNPQARFDVQWSLANYLLIKYAHTYFWFGGVAQYGGAPLWQHEFSAPVGSPADDEYFSQGVYMREYTNGLAIVNPDPSQTLRVTLPRGRYWDLYGNNVNDMNMPPHSGIVLLGQATVTGLGKCQRILSGMRKREFHHVVEYAVHPQAHRTRGRHRRKRARRPYCPGTRHAAVKANSSR